MSNVVLVVTNLTPPTLRVTKSLTSAIADCVSKQIEELRWMSVQMELRNGPRKAAQLESQLEAQISLPMPYT